MAPLNAVFNHLVLPPHLPGEQDEDIDGLTADVTQRMIRACQTAREMAASHDSSWTKSYEHLLASLEACRDLNCGHLEKRHLLSHFEDLAENEVLPLYVAEQNAGLLIRKHEIDGEMWVVFESFEASATSEQTVAAGHAIHWDFPGRSARIPANEFSISEFQHSLAGFLEKASMESLYTLQASTRKAGVSVTEMLMSILEAIGTSYQPPTLRKHVRDDVNFGMGDLPWRRLPFWLVLRVASQRQLCLSLGNAEGQMAYKTMMATLFAHMLEDCTDRLDPDVTNVLRSKLARRMAKIEMYKEELITSDAEKFKPYLEGVSSMVRETLKTSSEKMELFWHDLQQETIRRIDPLPRRALASDFELTLPNSGRYLEGILARHSFVDKPLGPVSLPNPLEEGIKRTQEFTNQVHHLAAIEEETERASSTRSTNYQADCMALADQIKNLLRETKRICIPFPEHMSSAILALFSLWVKLDACAIAACPLLSKHCPAFSPELLDALHLPAKKSMELLQRIQQYLAERHAKSQLGNILASPHQLAKRYCDHSSSMRILEQKIQTESDSAQASTAKKLEHLHEEYDDLTEDIASRECCCTWEDGERIVKGCTKCFLWRKRKKLQIKVQEAFLPQDQLHRTLIVFELAIPDFISAYRDATWKLLSQLTHPSRPRVSKKVEVHLEQCGTLCEFMSANVDVVSLASTVKCFEQTHYKFSTGKVPPNRVILPFAADFRLFDHESQIWIEDLDQPLTLQHHCGLSVPPELMSVFPLKQHPPTTVEGPSSYDVQANQTLCHTNMSIHEFSALQKLLAGTRRRWPNLLVELSSSNINVSNADTMLLLCQLAVQAGPGLPNEPLRAVHEIFNYTTFTDKLLIVMERLLRGIITNWREHNCLELVVTLTLRLVSLSPNQQVIALLHEARRVTLRWLFQIRKEIRSGAASEAAKRFADYGLHAALLCRRTFAIHLDCEEEMSVEDLEVWIQSSIFLQENTLDNINELSPLLRRFFIRDAKMTYHLVAYIKAAMRSYRVAVGVGVVKGLFGSSDGSGMAFSSWTFLEGVNDRWIVATSSEPNPQRLHYNFIEGHVLVNGKPRGKLPIAISSDQDVKRIFQGEHLLTVSSSIPGMTDRLLKTMNGHEVHFGIRDGHAVIRTIHLRTKPHRIYEVLEFVPERHFNPSPSGIDIPYELVRNCSHWLNLTTGILEIRRALPGSEQFWTTRRNDWLVDLKARKAVRGIGGSKLVDPQSRTFHWIAKTLQYFERPEMLTVYQPSSRGRLSVALRHMDLTFEVNQNQLLESRQLNAEIDPDQDAGSWYGLRSKLVLRDIQTGKRSVIVPFGELKVKRRGKHVDIDTTGANIYGRYIVDDILGRFSCPPEPLMVCTKALYHALTSRGFADPLTKRTGFSEALSILQSGVAQPWTPLSAHVIEILKQFDKLVPHRAYYPPKIKRLQRVIWDSDLLPSMQHDCYRIVVDAIKNRSHQLNTFHGGGFIKPLEADHLRHRGVSQRALYETLGYSDIAESSTDILYSSRDIGINDAADRVYKVAKSIRSNLSSFQMSRSLMSILEENDVIGGFSSDDDPEGGPTHLVRPLIAQIEGNVIERWGELVNICRRSDSQFTLIFVLGLLSFNNAADMDIIQSFAAIGTVDKLRHLKPPDHKSFKNIQSRGPPDSDQVEKLVSAGYPEFVPAIKANRRKTEYEKFGRTEKVHKLHCEEAGKKIVQSIGRMWPRPADQVSASVKEIFDDSSCDTSPTRISLDISSILKSIIPEWERRLAACALEDYVNQVQEVFDSIRYSHEVAPVQPSQKSPDFKPILSSSHLMLSATNVSSFIGGQTRVPRSFTLDCFARPSALENSLTEAQRPEVKELGRILSRFAKTKDAIREQYAEGLQRSLAVLEVAHQPAHLDVQGLGQYRQPIEQAIAELKICVQNAFEQILSGICSQNAQYSWLRAGDVHPYAAPVELIVLLRSTTKQVISLDMKKAIISYCLCITELQRVKRIAHALYRRDKRAFTDEFRNPGHENWDPLSAPDWLLMEVDSDILIRSEQIQVAREIITPQTGENSVLQMNMGQGKTSCIVPMAMCILANGRNLARLITPKALLMQTAQMLQMRLGGVVGRDVLHMPFSRKTQTTPYALSLYEKIHNDAYFRKGLILTCHEHLLSFKLGGWQKLADSEGIAASKMLSFQNWLDKHCRDVLDECDFTLSVKTQLNYPSGLEMPVDGHPYRWQVAEELLELVTNCVADVQHQWKRSIEIRKNAQFSAAQSYPIIHFLKPNGENALHKRIINDICAGKATCLQSDNSNLNQNKNTIREILSGPRVDESKLLMVSRLFPNPAAAANMLLLIRGLLENRILIACLGKRWNVQYGLHPLRHPVAVPFEAKGKPSEQAEYGHPDVAIVFTCLSFYYGGLRLEQLVQGVQHVLQSDDPAAQYERWTSGCTSLPEELRHWNSINIDDKGQMEELWKNLRFYRIVINHYLNHFVFPAHARQFETKLQACSWDIPLISEAGHNAARSTGFSGTNDNRLMLPLTIRQNDLGALEHTSAEVLSYLLQKRNSTFRVTKNSKGLRLSEHELLEALTIHKIPILIDAGAYILEMDNLTLVAEWLRKCPEAEAAVYFKADNRAWVHFRGDTKEDVPLLATPFADDLSRCLVYLDEAHTRGVDLKLPQEAHGAVTLALNQTKDFTIQAAMRLRQLRTSQRITFYGPPEVEQSIKDLCHLNDIQYVNSSHVVYWLLEQTCRSIRDLQMLHVAQGVDFCKRTDAVWHNKDFLVSDSQQRNILRVLKQPERQTLRRLYGPPPVKQLQPVQRPLHCPMLQKFRASLARSANNQYECLPANALQEVEQEREVELQVEQVREVQHRTHYRALEYPGIHPDIVQFARTGTLPDSHVTDQHKAGYEHAFAWLSKTSVGRKFEVRVTMPQFFVSREFGRTIKESPDSTEDDNFLRPVDWILWSPSTETALVIIPEEAEWFLERVQDLTLESPVHIIGYATPVTKMMLQFDSLDLFVRPQLPPGYQFPAWLSRDIGILAGRLYVPLKEREELARYIQPSSQDPNTDSFTLRMPGFLLEWLTLRRKAVDILHTHLGFMCTGRSPRKYR
ncbi:hypothetical protein GGR57DRAFT_515463 [Xylariaceae sp. FL1272]|nr:hypothetical protein GGR57DRAFT_515463 [Xylariaceae sp. FL1272]